MCHRRPRPLPASRRAQLGLGDGAAFDFGSPAEEVLRAAVDDLEARNRGLQDDNRRLWASLDRTRDDLKDATEKMIVAQAQRARLQQRLQQLSPEAAAEAAAAAEALAEGTSSEGDGMRGQLERIAELEREVKRLQQVSRCGGGLGLAGWTYAATCAQVHVWPDRHVLNPNPLSSTHRTTGCRARLLPACGGSRWALAAPPATWRPARTRCRRCCSRTARRRARATTCRRWS